MSEKKAPLPQKPEWRLAWLTAIVLLLLAACQGLAQPGTLEDALSEPALDDRITEYLAEQIAITGFGGKAYCAYQMLPAEQGKDGYLYLWAFCQEYYLEEGSLTEGSGISVPVALQIEQENLQIKIVGHLLPRDGTYYGPDVRSIFPKSAWQDIMPGNEGGVNQYNFRANELMESVRIQALADSDLESED